MGKVKIWCIGLGAQFQNHLLKVLTENGSSMGFTVAGLFDLDAGKGAKVAKAFSDAAAEPPAVMPDVKALIEAARKSASSGDDALCVVSTPPDTHYMIARQCLEAGCHVYVDKPFVQNARAARSLLESAAARNLQIVVGAQRRFEAIFRALRDNLALVGAPRRVTVRNFGNFKNIDPFHKESHIVPNGMAYHSIDTLMWLLPALMPDGTPPELRVVGAVTQTWDVNPEHFVSVDALLECGGRMPFPITLSCSCLSPEDYVDESIVVTGTKGELSYVRKYYPRRTESGDVVFMPFRGEAKPEERVLASNLQPDRGAPLRQLLRGISAKTFDAIESTGSDALLTVALIDDILRAAAQL